MRNLNIIRFTLLEKHFTEPRTFLVMPLDLDPVSLQTLEALINEGDAEAIVDFLASFDIVVNIESLSRIINEIKEVDAFIQARSIRPESFEELEQIRRFIVTDALIPGRNLIVIPSLRIREDDERSLNGTFVTILLINEGAIADTGESVGDNLFTELFLNDGAIKFDNGKDFIVAVGGGISNNGLINTGAQFDLVSGSATGVKIVDGVLNTGDIQLSRGNDRLIGFAVGVGDIDGIENTNLIMMGKGNDLIRGDAVGNDAVSAIVNSGIINTGRGSDAVIGDARGLNLTRIDESLSVAEAGFVSGILNQSLIATGTGADQIKGDVFAEASASSIGGDSFGILNEGGNIQLGDGNDELLGDSIAIGSLKSAGIASFGIFPKFFDFSLPEKVVIDLGEGNDLVRGNAGSGTGEQSAGITLIATNLISKSGNNLIQGNASGGITNNGIFVDAFSKIELGEGIDLVTGIAVRGEFNSGITNFGVIKLGKGNDAIDASRGGFNGDGKTKLGRGDDVISGFGSGSFNGGGGTDTISLGEGVYEFDSSTKTLTSDGTTMNLRKVEEIKGFNDMQSLSLIDGEYVIDSSNMLVQTPAFPLL